VPSNARMLITWLLAGLLAGACRGVNDPPTDRVATPGADATSSPSMPAVPTPEPIVSGNLLGSPGRGDWPAYGYGLNNSVHNPDETALSPETVGGLIEAWRLDTGGVTATPVVVAGIAYFGDWTGTVRAVDARSGATAWERQATTVPISASAAVSTDLVIVGDLSGGLHALNRRDGTTAWSTRTNTFESSLFASPVVIGDMLVVGMTESELSEDEDPAFRAAIVAFNLADGTERWRVFTDPDDSPGYWVSVWSSAAYDQDRGLIFVGTGNTNAPGRERSVENLPLADGVIAINAESGTQVWFTQVALDNGLDLDVGASPNLFRIGDRDVVGVGGKSGDYVVLDRETGDVIWKQHLTAGSGGGGVMQTAAVDDGRIYVASNASGGPATIFALDRASGSIDWEHPMTSSVFGGSMALANGVLYRGLWSGGLFALDASDGSELWSLPGGGPYAGGATIADGMLYVGYGSGQPHNMVAPNGGLIAWRLPS